MAERDEDGAVVTFTGKVRNHNLGDSVKALTLEHYPGMTEKALAEIVDEARNRWPLGRVKVIHRIGELWPGDEIVFVGVTSAHRSSAFEAGNTDKNNFRVLHSDDQVRSPPLDLPGAR
ncbi:molybdopterin synthase catalytic subunit MoaE, partial [Pseudomonas aeruginosa]|uniref:molybdopterin synthase catalytic subunit MoaE n=1 Tax=Pseudomonas aeruginosa TaxID=287 RepID=UPI0031B7ECC8